MNIFFLASYFISAFAAMNWGLYHFFKLNIITHFTETFRLNMFIDLLYVIVFFSGLIALISLFV